MAALHHRDPGLAGLVTAIPVQSHLHPSMASMLFRANPEKCILITDSIELAGLEDGMYPGHAQIPHKQEQKGSSLAQCVQDVVEWSGCSVAEAVRSVSENISNMMGDEARGRIPTARRAVFVVSDEKANVPQTWVSGEKVWQS